MSTLIYFFFILLSTILTVLKPDLAPTESSALREFWCLYTEDSPPEDQFIESFQKQNSFPSYMVILVSSLVRVFFREKFLSSSRMKFKKK